MTWIQTLKGRAFHLLDPRPEEFDIEEIAHALAILPRYNGHAIRPYSIGGHSLFVADILRGRASEETQLAGLMHDCAEAYIGDVTRPLKAELPRYREIEQRIETIAAARFGYPWPMSRLVKWADDVMLRNEKLALLSKPDVGWSYGGEHGPSVDIPIAQPCWMDVRFDELGGVR